MLVQLEVLIVWHEFQDGRPGFDSSASVLNSPAQPSNYGDKVSIYLGSNLTW